MNNLFNTYRPDGFSTVNSYLFVSNPRGLIDFLKRAFEAQEVSLTLRPDNGLIANCILKIGDSCIMISQANGAFVDMRSALYLYTNDVDTLYEHAVALGAKSVFPPANQEYGDRQAGIEDPCGNYWWISQRLEEKGYKE